MIADARGWRIALIPAALINPPDALRAALPDVLGLLESCGYGLLQLPPPGEHRLLLAVICEQVFEYLHHGYAVVAVGLQGEPDSGLHWRRLASLLRQRGASLPPRHVLHPAGDLMAEEQKLKEMLSGYDLPLAERQRWRS